MKNWIISLSLLICSSAFANERTMTVKHLQTGSSYFNVTVHDSGPLNGSFAGWCADWNTLIEDDVLYTARFHSSLASEFPEGVVDHPEYLDEVNWMMNQNFVGKVSPMGLGAYTIGDVQLAIWSLIDDEYDTDTVGEYSQERVNELVARAKVEGAGYNPDCSKLVGIILMPVDPSTGSKKQNTLILVPRYKFPKCSVPDSDDVL
jgi:hypothetical protein